MIQVIFIPLSFLKKNLFPKRDKLIVIDLLSLLLLIIYTNKAIRYLIDPLITMIMNEKLQEQASRLPQYEVEKIIDERKDGSTCCFIQIEPCFWSNGLVTLMRKIHGSQEAILKMPPKRSDNGKGIRSNVSKKQIPQKVHNY